MLTFCPFTLPRFYFSNLHRRLYEDVKTKTTEESYESGPQKRKSDNREHSAGFV